MKIAVTGAGGQLGSDLVKFLCAKGVELFSFKKADLDIGDYGIIKERLHDRLP